MRLACALQFAPWDDARLNRAYACQEWYEGMHPEWAGKLTLVGDRGEDRHFAEGVWPTNLRAWWACLEDEQATHAWVWQEDMEPCRGFWSGLRNALRAAPMEIIVMLCARQGMVDAKASGLSWLTLPDGTWAGTTVFPVPLLREFLQWEGANVSPQMQSADARVDLWLRSTGRVAYATVPSLMQHLDMTSLIGHGRGRSTDMLAQDGAAIDFDDPTELAHPGVKALNKKMFTYLLKEAS